MRYRLNKYFADELTPDEKSNFLLEVVEKEGLREQFIQNQCVIALIDWQFQKSDRAVVQQKLSDFLNRMGEVKNK